MSKTQYTQLDRLISAFTAVNAHQTKQLSRAILLEQVAINEQIDTMNQELASAAFATRQLLAKQLEEEAKREKQKLLKVYAFHLYELTEFLSKIKDPMVLSYFMAKCHDKIKVGIVEVMDSLEELADKAFAKQIKDKLHVLSLVYKDHASSFANHVLSGIDRLLADLQEKEARIAAIKVPEFRAQPIARSRENHFRTVVAAIFAFLSLATFITTIAELHQPVDWFHLGNQLLFTALFLAVFVLLFFAEKRWRHQYDDFIKSQIIALEQYQSKKPALVKEVVQKIEEEKALLASHGFYVAMQEISTAYPEFLSCLEAYNAMETEFKKKVAES